MYDSVKVATLAEKQQLLQVIFSSRTARIKNFDVYLKKKQSFTKQIYKINKTTKLTIP